MDGRIEHRAQSWSNRVTCLFSQTPEEKNKKYEVGGRKKREREGERVMNICRKEIDDLYGINIYNAHKL